MSETGASKLEEDYKNVSNEYNSLSNTIDSLKIYAFSEFVSDEKNEYYVEANLFFNIAFQNMYLFMEGEKWSFFDVEGEGKFTIEEFFGADESQQVSIQTYPDHAIVTVHDMETSHISTFTFNKANRDEQICFLTKFFS